MVLDNDFRVHCVLGKELIFIMENIIINETAPKGMYFTCIG